MSTAHPVSFTKEGGIVPLKQQHCSAKVPVSLPSHDRGYFFPQPWRIPTTAVGRSRHGRGELPIPV